MNTNWIIKNNPFEIINIAFNRIFPNVKYTAYFHNDIGFDEEGNKAYGLTNIEDNGEITIFIDGELSINDAVEIFAHELAHAGVGVEQEHNEVWEKAFDDLFNEYNKICEEFFSQDTDHPTEKGGEADA